MPIQSLQPSIFTVVCTSGNVFQSTVFSRINQKVWEDVKRQCHRQSVPACLYNCIELLAASLFYQSSLQYQPFQKHICFASIKPLDNEIMLDYQPLGPCKVTFQFICNFFQFTSFFVFNPKKFQYINELCHTYTLKLTSEFFSNFLEINSFLRSYNQLYFVLYGRVFAKNLPPRVHELVVGYCLA